MTDPLTTASTTTLRADEVAAVVELVEAAAVADGFSALNEAALLHLRHDRPGVVHVLARRGPRLVGYAQLDGGSTGAFTSTGQLVVSPADRRSGVGSALLSELLSITVTPLQLWAMGNTPAARALAVRHALRPARTLLIMTRPLDDPIPDAPVTGGVLIRTFVVGQDEEDWLQVNARAFWSHPEQGQLTRADLDDRMAEDWFDPEGFFVAVPDPAAPYADGSRSTGDRPTGLLGFHWTKQHPDHLGEVYVLGVDPAAGSRGLGRALLVRGLQHLRERGNTLVQLYVEADHDRAVGLYSAYGFSESSRDVMYAQDDHAAPEHTTQQEN
jgi:mycothiol synthase